MGGLHVGAKTLRIKKTFFLGGGCMLRKSFEQVVCFSAQLPYVIAVIAVIAVMAM